MAILLPALPYARDAINVSFGSFGKFVEAFNKAAIGAFGSGWVWLVRRPDDVLAVVSTSNAETPLTGSNRPRPAGKMRPGRGPYRGKSDPVSPVARQKSGPSATSLVDR